MKMIGSASLISCALLLGACAVEVPEEEIAESTGELEAAKPASDGLTVIGETEVDEQSVEQARPSAAPDGATIAEAEAGAVGTATDALAIRASLSYGYDCHTFQWLIDQSAIYCGALGYNYVTDWNFTYDCTGWWGAGARKVWFTCFN
jgi:hypothetical protein